MMRWAKACGRSSRAAVSRAAARVRNFMGSPSGWAGVPLGWLWPASVPCRWFERRTLVCPPALGALSVRGARELSQNGNRGLSRGLHAQVAAPASGLYRQGLYDDAWRTTETTSA